MLTWTDGHLDLAYLVACGRDLRVACRDPQRESVSLPALRDAHVDLVLATIFIEPGKSGPAGYGSKDDLDGAEAAAIEQLDAYDALESQGEIAIARKSADLDPSAAPRARPLVVILMEGGDPIRSPEDAARWHARGVRLVGLSWAMGTRWAGGNARGGPLTGTGEALVAALDRLGIVHDLSHLSDAACDRLLEIARGPVVATHSNCRALLAGDFGPAGAERHLRDETIREIGAREGIVGLNLFSPFLVLDRRATIRDCVRHVEHVAEVMGHRRGIALGSDMDGGFGPDQLPEGLEHASKLVALAEALAARGWSDEEVRGFAGTNWRRFLANRIGIEDRTVG